eukprot:s92_g43.t1
MRRDDQKSAVRVVQFVKAREVQPEQGKKPASFCYAMGDLPDAQEDAAVAGTNGSSKRPAPEVEQNSAKVPRSEEADEKSEVEKLLEAKKRALMEAKRAALAKLDPEDIRKLFTRVHQLEIRQVAGKRDVEAGHQGGPVESMKSRRAKQVSGGLRSSLGTLEAVNMEDSVQDALLEALSKNSLEQNVQELALQCRELDKTCLKHAELLEGLEARIKPLEFAKDETNNFKTGQSKLTIHTDRLKNISQVLDRQGQVLELHGVSGEADSLSQRQDKAEEACNNAMRSSTAARQEVEGVVSRVDEGWLVDEVQKWPSLDWGAIAAHVHGADTSEAQIYEPDVSHEGSPGGNERINTGLSVSKAGFSSGDIVQCLDDMQDLLRWRSQARDEMDRCPALWRRVEKPMADRLEAFDVLERRTEDLAQHLEALGSPVGPLIQQLLDEAQPPGHISSPNFAGAASTGFAKVPPRRPYSAGAIQGDAPSQLQQLREKILQAVPALPPELQKQLEAANKSAASNGVFPCRPPAAGAAFAICRPGSRSGPAMRRPAKGEGREEAGETTENAEQEMRLRAVEGVADVSIVDFLRKQTEEGRGKALSEAGKRPGLVCSAPPVYVQREPKKELAAAGDAGAIVALAGPGPAPKVIPGVPTARPASKASGHWAWGGSDGGVAFVPPKRPPLNAVQAQAGAAAATLLVRAQPWPPCPLRGCLPFQCPQSDLDILEVSGLWDREPATR